MESLSSSTGTVIFFLRNRPVESNQPEYQSIRFRHHHIGGTLRIDNIDGEKAPTRPRSLMTTYLASLGGHEATKGRPDPPRFRGRMSGSSATAMKRQPAYFSVPLGRWLSNCRRQRRRTRSCMRWCGGGMTSSFPALEPSSTSPLSSTSDTSRPASLLLAPKKGD